MYLYIRYLTIWRSVLCARTSATDLAGWRGRQSGSSRGTVWSNPYNNGNHSGGRRSKSLLQEAHEARSRANPSQSFTVSFLLQRPVYFILCTGYQRRSCPLPFLIFINLPESQPLLQLVTASRRISRCLFQSPTISATRGRTASLVRMEQSRSKIPIRKLTAAAACSQSRVIHHGRRWVHRQRADPCHGSPGRRRLHYRPQR